ncbi:MAG: calcium-binding protein [Cyanobacteria bacterium J06588_4]
MQEFIVSTLEDESDGDFSTEDLSLREAIALANQAEGTDTVTFADGLNGSIVLSQGELLIDDPVIIKGLGAENITIDGNAQSRIFNLDDGNEATEIEVSIDNLTLTNGSALDPNSGRGAGILNQENLSLNGVVIQDNTARFGGGIFSTGTLALSDSSISGNSAIQGAGVYNYRGNSTVVNSTIADNSSDFKGGGIQNFSGNLEVRNSSLTGNLAAESGGGISNYTQYDSATATVVNSTISGNSSPSGSGIYNSSKGLLNLEGSTVSQNNSNFSENSVIVTKGTANISNSAISDNDGAQNVGILVDSGTATIENSAIANNNAPDIGISGIIVRRDGLVDVVNSTVANNTSRANAGIVGSGTVNVLNSTVVNNNGGIGTGGVSFTEGIVTITSSIVANNVGTGDGRLVGDITGEFVSGGNNLISNGDDTSGFVESDLVGSLENPLNPQVGELQDNGGTTQTIALLEGSPAINAGSNPNGLTFDQRGNGFNRTIGNGTDIGAFELQTIDNGGGGTIPDELIVSTLEDENDGDLSAGDLSLREAIAIAESGDTITFDSSLSGGTIGLSLGELVIAQDLTISGLGAGNITLSGDGSRVFRIDDGDSSTAREVIIDGLTIANGNDNNAEEGGGGILNAENLTLQNSVVTNGSAGGADGGGGIRNSGTANILNSTIQDNSAFRVGGAISSDGTLIIRNSTVDSNFSAAGINIISSGVTDISNSTISGNTGNVITFGTTTLTSSIIADNTTIRFSRFGQTVIPDLDIEGFISGDNNLIGKGNGNFINGVNGNIVGTVDNPLDPLLGELQNNGGSTATRELLPGSPAIDAGSNPNSLATDQRGNGFNRTVGNGTDIGAFERQTVTEVNEIIGTAVGDVLNGTEESDRLLGLDGNDTLRGLGGDDTIEGNNGNDSLEGGAGNDLLDGFEGFDSLFGGEGSDTLNGDVGNDSLDGSLGDDFISGADGRDTLLGGEGNDTLDGGSDSDSLNGGAGDDQLIGLGDRDTLIGGSGDDWLDGGAGVDSLTGGEGNDTLLGLEDNDSLFGGSGDDLIAGGLGSDSLRGDDGNDTFVLTPGSGTDIIVDFGRGNDLLGLSSGLNFSDLSFSGNDVVLGTETLATLNGFSTANLTEANFVNI